MSLHSIYVRTSLLAIFFITLHYTDDVIRKVRGMDQGGIAVLFAVLILVVWLYAVLVLAERKSGYIISLIVSLLNSLIPLGHLTGMAGEATPGEILTSSGPFFVWVVIALGLTVFPSLILSAYLLFRPSTEKSAHRVSEPHESTAAAP
jgi:NO-binding membrane sensor protein with MHYT domain